MIRFFAILWDATDPDASEAARNLVDDRVFEGRKVLTCASGLLLADLSDPGSQASLIPVGGTGAIIGTLFNRSIDLTPSACLKHVPESLGKGAHTPFGEALIDGYWGSYVAFLAGPDQCLVVPDPTSSIACFYMRRGPLTLVFSHLESCPSAIRKGLTINYRFVSNVLAYDKIQNGETGLTGIHELQGGHILTVSPAGLRETMAWDPRRLARSPNEPSAAEASEFLRQVIRYSVQSWGMSVPEIALGVSGGLDSAIVAACLVDPKLNADICGVHFVLESGDPSEAAYARDLANFLGLPLEEARLEPDEPIPPPEACPLSVRPYREFLGLTRLQRQASMPALSGRTMLTGQGGDHLFLETRSPLGLADYLLRNGPSLGSGRELLCAARLSGLSIWQVLREVLPVAASRGQRAEALYANLASRRTRVNRMAHEGLDPARLLPQWARSPEGVAPAKFAQVVSLVHMFQVRSTLLPSGSPPLIHPLISQPLIEACLAIPTYTLCAGGVPRGLARQAMAGLIPETIRLRRSKGDASRYFIEQLRSNHALLAGSLLDGALIAGGFIDRADIARFLKPAEYEVQTFGRMILAYYAIECWLRRWQSELRAI